MIKDMSGFEMFEELRRQMGDSSLVDELGRAICDDELADLCEWVGRMNGIDFEEVDDD